MRGRLAAVVIAAEDDGDVVALLEANDPGTFERRSLRSVRDAPRPRPAAWAVARPGLELDDAHAFQLGQPVWRDAGAAEDLGVVLAEVGRAGLLEPGEVALVARGGGVAEGKAEVGVLDRFGESIANIQGEVVDDRQLAPAIDRMTRYRGPITLRPSVWVLHGALSGSWTHAFKMLHK